MSNFCPPSKEQIENKDDAPGDARAPIRMLNDKLRIEGRGGKIMETLGVRELNDETRTRVLEAVRSFTAFTPDNDPFGEHDFGEVTVDDITVMFKIDYYDKDERFHSPDAADPSVTLRVMTIMLSDEY
jgi:hypothetical protein